MSPPRTQAAQPARISAYWTHRVGCVATLRLAGAVTIVKAVVSSWGYKYPHTPDVWANARPGRTTQLHDDTTTREATARAHPDSDSAAPTRVRRGGRSASRTASSHRTTYREMIVPSITAREFARRDGPGSAERAGGSAADIAAMAAMGSHTVREPPERPSDLEELSHGR